MKAGLYKRVSTLEQKKFGYSIQAQEEKMQSYCKAMNWQVVENYTDDGFSGATANRPALIRLIEDVKRHAVDIIVIYKLDRLSRDVRDTLNLVDLFIENKVQLYSLSEQIDLTSPFGRAALTMSATFSAMEREVIKERTILGKEQRIKKGMMLGVGKNGAPFGYRLISKEKRFEIIPEEAEMIKIIFDLYVNKDYTIRKLYPYARETFNHPFFSNEMCCQSILKRSAYAGYFTYKGELYKGTNFEPIISYELFLQAQEKMKRNGYIRNHETSPYLLTGLLYCGECGNRFVGKRSKRFTTLKDGEKNFHEDTYYGCAARIKRDRNYTPVKCKNKIYPAEQLDELISSEINNLNFSEFEAGETPQGVFDKLIADNTEQEEKKNKLLDLYLDGKIDIDVFEKRSLACDDIIKKNRNIISAEQERIKDKPIYTINYLKEKQKEFPTADKGEKRKILLLLIKHITIVDNQINIKWRVK